MCIRDSASPIPKRIVEFDAVRDLVEDGLSLIHI